MIEAAGTVANPYDGWKGPHVSAKKDVPFLANEPNIIELVVNITGLKNTSAIGMSCFGWIANRYRAVGSPAHKRTVNWWNSLKRWMAAQSAARISRFGPLDKHPEIWVFPCALIKINGGKDREANAL